MNGLQFFHPLLAAAAAALVIPVIIHLIHRRHAVPHPFAAVRFVQLSVRRTARAFRIKQLLLLLARILLFIALPLAVARLAWLPEQTGAASAGQAPASVAIVLDTSFSMSLAEDEESMLSRAKGTVEEYLQRLPASNDALLLVTVRGPGEEALSPSLTHDKAALFERLKKVKQSESWASLPDAIGKAWDAIKSSPKKVKRIVVVSDFARNGWQDAESLFAGEPDPPQVELLDVRDGHEADNAAIADVDAFRDYGAGAQQYRVTVEVRNFGRAALKQRKVSVFMDGAPLANGFVDVAPGAGEQKLFTVKVTAAGEHVLEARLDADNLTLDDRRFGVLSAPPPLRVLAVNGEPSSTFYRDELFYLRNALDPQRLGQSGIAFDETTPDQLLRPQFDGYDMVALANVATLPDPAVTALKDYVRRGGGLFIAAGERVQIDFYNDRMLDLLPGELRSPKAPGGAEAGTGAKASVGLLAPDRSHPLLRVFDDEAVRALLGTSFTRSLPFSPDPRRRKTIVLRYTDNQPALVEYRIGDGRAVLFTATLDRDWSDFCIRTAFLPLMQESARFLSRSVNRHAPPPSLVGQSLSIPTPDGVTGAVLLDAQGEQQVLTMERRTALPDETIADAGNMLVIPPQFASGLYRIRTQPRGEELPLPINVDVAESDLRRIPENEVLALFKRDAGTLASFASEVGGVKEYTRYFAWLALAALLLEAWLLRGFSRTSALRGNRRGVLREGSNES